MIGDVADTQQYAGHEGRAVEAVVADRQRLPHGSEQNLLVGNETRQSHRVHPDAVDVSSTGGIDAGAGGIGAGRQPLSRLGDQVRRAGRRSRWRVRLERVVQFDDLRGLEEARRLTGERHRQHRADREVGGDENRHVGLGGEPGPNLIESFVGEARGAHDRVDARPDEELEVVHHHAGMGEVDDDLGLALGEQGQRITCVHARSEGQVFGRLDRTDDRRAHLALCTQHAHSHDRQPTSRSR